MKKRKPFLFFIACAVLLAPLLLLAKRLLLPSEAYDGFDKAFWIMEPLFAAAFFFALAAISRKNFKIYLCVSLGSICLFFAAAESYLRLSDPALKNASAQSAHIRSGEVTHTEEELYARDQLLGGALKKQARRPLTAACTARKKTRSLTSYIPLMLTAVALPRNGAKSRFCRAVVRLLHDVRQRRG